jgi:phage baseplate assembly protein W
MPIPQTIRVNPLDLQGNIAIGVSLPFNGPSGRPFNSTYSTKIQTRFNLINLILTNPGERVMNPNFGCPLKKVLFENSGLQTDILIEETIRKSTEIYLPTVDIMRIEINKENIDKNIINISIFYKLKISQEEDQITVQLV